MHMIDSARRRPPWRAVAALWLLFASPLDAQDAGVSAPPELAPQLVAPRLLPEGLPPLPELPAGSTPRSAVIELTVDREGRASDPVVLTSAGEELDRAALAAVPALRFSAATRDGAPISARIPFRFDFFAAAPALPPAAPSEAPQPAPPAEPELVAAVTLDVQGEKPPRETTVHELAPSETQKLPGTNGDPVRALESLPGVARPPAFEGMLLVRGSAPEDSVVFVDGVQIPLAYHFGSFASVVPGDSLQKLEFRPGNFGAEYGRAMGGSVALALRAPNRERLSAVVQLDTFDGRLLLEGPLGSRTRFIVGARRSWIDSWIGKTDDDIESAPVYYDGQAVLEHDFNQRTTARLFFLGADDRMRLFFDSPDASDPSEGGKLSVGTRFTRLALRVDTRFSEDLQLTQTYSWGTDHFGVREGVMSQDIDAQVLAARVELRARMTRWLSGAIGLDAQFSRYDVTLNVPPYDATDAVEGPDFGRPLRTFDERVWLHRPAAYALLELTPIEGLRIVPALRADYDRDTEQVTLDPRLTVRGDVRPAFPRTTLKAGVGQYSQHPQGQESAPPFGTKGVESNRALHVSAGIEQELAPGFELSLEGFYKKLDQLVISRADERQRIGARFVNSGEGRVFGGEALLRYRSDDARFFGWIAYTLSRSERRNDAAEPYHLFAYDQTHVLSALGNVQLGRGFSAGARFRYVTGSPYTPIVGGVVDLDVGAYAPIAGRSNSGRLPAFHQLDLRLDKTWQAKRAKIIAYLELRNAYNRENAEELSYRFDYSASKRVSGLPILPLIGLRGEL